MELIRNSTGVIVFTGAGVSTNSGIPDYRSRNGIYKTLEFTRKSCSESPIFKELEKTMLKAEPTNVHYFCSELHRQNKLIRVYTQNIDLLHEKAGLDPEKIVHVHGSISSDIVFMGEEISQQTKNMIRHDLVDNVKKVDLVIVMGTSLQVLPFAALPNMVGRACGRLFINNDLSILPSAKRGTEMIGFYSQPGTSYMDICGRRVTTKPTWFDARLTKPGIRPSKWKTQYLFASDCDQWVKENSPYQLVF